MWYFEYIGLKKAKKDVESDTDLEQNLQQYENITDIKLADRYLTYLKEIDSYQKDRRVTIENKNSQLVGQASIVTSIFALFVPLLLDGFKDLSWAVKVSLTVVFVFIMFHYLMTIFHAIKTLKINKYSYATRSASSVTKASRAKNEIEFLNEEINDLVIIVNQASPVDNIKGENLILGTRCFEIANFGFGLLTFMIIVSSFLIEEDSSEIKISNIKELKMTVIDTVKVKAYSIQQNSITPNKSVKDSLKTKADNVKNNDTINPNGVSTKKP
ncbi:hypothetical protein [Flavobacterium nitrogenifigens]|uniref:Uncharacterized protein n=1 Tax=Flavobacterium nitrogenifigens TaxID=1617283 RepID=A0A521AFX5_9FLAO|nr:hypothetical protein [Flavobacterium nitrogenifigens]KAF2331500.1 hypothetical protein DM397_12245 [Flavobacterium nitrogenifigens]SMO33691.1 hypothetical protein SAMN06265220_10199 [Flavobacterium nitrogenifigens]